MFLTLKRKSIIAVFCSLLIIAIVVVYFTAIRPAFVPKPLHTIVIDAGHGGRDGGTTGSLSGVSESELNLKYAKCLASLCEEFGIKAVLTRKDMNGLYDEGASNKKRSEMEKREKIINNSKADLMVSLHMNSFPLSSCEGAQVFYAKGSESGCKLAKCVQENICKSFDNARGYVTVGDYYVLNCAKMPAILVECGFLSNQEEEMNLQKDDYCKNFCYSILAGIISFFN